MELRQRTTEARAAALPGDAPTGGGPLNEMAAAAQHFLKAGNDAIKRALSKGNSEDFLAANRQSGGQ